MIRFTCQDQFHTLAPGDHFARARETGFRDTSASDLQTLIEEIAGGLETMPPKSTYFYPKLLSGLVFHALA